MGVRLGSNTTQKYLITNTNTVKKQQIQIQIQIVAKYNYKYFVLKYSTLLQVSIHILWYLKMAKEQEVQTKRMP